MDLGARVSIEYLDFSNTYVVTQKTEPDEDSTEGVKTRIAVNWGYGPLQLVRAFLIYSLCSCFFSLFPPL